MVGNNNTSKLSPILTEKGKLTGLLFSPWTRPRKNVDQMSGFIRKKIGEEEPAVVILQLMDNNIFFINHEDGIRLLPRLGNDSFCGIEGECVQETSKLTTSEHCRTQFSTKWQKRLCLCVSPMPRYITAGCCDKQSHVSNRRDNYFVEDMRLKLDAPKHHMKDATLGSSIWIGKRILRPK
jgi:hypothetical protein